MRLSELLSPSRIRIPLHARDKAGVLRELTELMVGDSALVGPALGAGAGVGPGTLQGTQVDEVMGAILERERQFPTGIGYGVAVPHGKTPALAGLGVVAGVSSDPIPYETIDGEPVRIFFMLAGPESLAGAHVKAISRISRLVRREPVRKRLLEARTAHEFYRVLSEAEGA